MRFGAVATLTLFVSAGFVACIPGGNLIETRPGSGGATGGSSTTPPSSGGVKSSGGTTSSGGVTSSGGINSGGSGGIASGGAGGSGGATASGGSTARGGSAGTAGTGSTTTSGGTTSSGGTTARGGAGGTTGSGGTSSSGGAPGSGGTTTSTTSTGTCTDDPAPGQPQTCAEWLSYGTCTQSWFATYCNRTCGRCSGAGSSGGASGSGGASARGGSGGGVGTGGVVGGTGGKTGAGGSTSPGSTNAQITGTNGWASRYWDCCKPSCGWTGNSNPPVPSCDKGGTTRVGVDGKNGCEGGGSAFECYDFSPWYDSGTNLAYGFAAYNGVACGTCFMLQFTGGGNSGPNDGAAALKGQQMVVQVINIGGIAANQFDILIPGGGVGAMNGCSTQWGSSTDLGVQYGGLLSECKGDATCMKGKCSSVFGGISSVLKAGCDWFTGWYSSADNPNLVYKQVSCPSQLSGKTGLSK